KRPCRITADISSESQREWISTRLVGPWIFEAHRVPDVPEIPWRQIRQAGHVPNGRIVIKRSAGDANRGSAVAIHIPRQPKARRKIPPLVVHALSVGESGVSVKKQARRRIREPG